MANYYKRRKVRERIKAIEWLIDYFSGNIALSWDELSEWGEHFRTIGKRFGLTREFRENGII